MSSRKCLCPQGRLYVPRVQFILLSTVYFLRVQFMSLYYSLCPNITVYVPMVQFISSENSLCPYTIVYVQRVQFMFQ